MYLADPGAVASATAVAGNVPVQVFLHAPPSQFSVGQTSRFAMVPMAAAADSRGCGATPPAAQVTLRSWSSAVSFVWKTAEYQSAVSSYVCLS